MNINAERFFALTAMLAAPLIAASACVITDSDNDTNVDTGDATVSTTASTMSGTDGTSGSPSTSASTGDGTGEATGDSTGDSSADDATGNSTGTTGGPDLGNCCVPDGSIGCVDPDIEACVCEGDPVCCSDGWDELCAQEVNSLGCGVCEFPPQAFDCYCMALCDDAIVDTPWQVCGTDFETAAVEGQAACEADLGATCTTFSCDECGCSTAEVPEIEC